MGHFTTNFAPKNDDVFQLVLRECVGYPKTDSRTDRSILAPLTASTDVWWRPNWWRNTVECKNVILKATTSIKRPRPPFGRPNNGSHIVFILFLEASKNVKLEAWLCFQLDLDRQSKIESDMDRKIIQNTSLLPSSLDVVISFHSVLHILDESFPRGWTLKDVRAKIF